MTASRSKQKSYLDTTWWDPYVETIAESGLTMYPIARQRLKEFSLAMNGYASAMKGFVNKNADQPAGAGHSDRG